MERVVFRALKKDPKDRFPSVKAFAEAFKQACGGCSSSGEREKQALPEKHYMANQVQKTDQGNNGKEQKVEKNASMSGTSSLQKGEASLSSAGREGITHDTEQQLLDHLRMLGFRPNDNAWLRGKVGEAFPWKNICMSLYKRSKERHGIKKMASNGLIATMARNI
jgi:hypothetical protein